MALARAVADCEDDLDAPSFSSRNSRFMAGVLWASGSEVVESRSVLKYRAIRSHVLKDSTTALSLGGTGDSST